MYPLIHIRIEQNRSPSIMNLEPSDEEVILGNMLDRFIAEHCDYSVRRKLLASARGFSKKRWQSFADMGLLGLSYPERFGGVGVGFPCTALVMEKFGKGLVVEPYFSTVILGGSLIKYSGNESYQTECLKAIAEGSMFVALAHLESDSHVNPQLSRTTARLQEGTYVVNGEKRLVIHGQSADRFIVSAHQTGHDEGDSLLLLLLDSSQSGLQVDPYRTIDGSPAFDLTLDNVVATRDQVLAEGRLAQEILDEVLTEATAALCAEASGCMQALFDATVEYVKERKQFGRPIGSFQAIQHRLVDCYADLEQTKSLVLLATKSVAAGSPERHINVAAAKAFVCEAALRTGHEAIQLHGAMGVTEELPVGAYHKRLLMIRTLFGDSTYQIDRMLKIGKHVG